MLTRTEPAPDPRSTPRRSPRSSLAGSVVGLLTGFFGVGGGFVIVPALVLTLGFAMPEAVGTSLVVIAINAAVALAMRAGSSTIDWSAALPFLVTAAAGTVIGGRIGERVDPRRLTGAFVVLLSVVAVYTGVSAAIALVADALPMVAIRALLSAVGSTSHAVSG